MGKIDINLFIFFLSVYFGHENMKSLLFIIYVILRTVGGSIQVIHCYSPLLSIEVVAPA